MKMDSAIIERPEAKVSSRIRKFHFVNSSKIWGGEERFVLDLATGLRRLDHAVVVYGRPGTEFLSRIQSVNVETKTIYPKFDYDFLPAGKFGRSSAEEIFVAITPRDFKLLRVLAFLRPRAKFFWHLGVAYPQPTREYRWLFKNEKLRLIAPSNYLKTKVLNDFRKLESRISVLPNGVPISTLDSSRARSALAEKFGVSSDELFLGIFSRLTGWKGHSLLFQALHLVKMKKIGFHLWVVGGGERERFEREVKELEIVEQVTFAGHQTDTDSYMAGVDIVCLPSQIDYSPYVVLEAMALGKPVLASDVGGVPEIIINERDGLLLSPKEPEAWAVTIAALAQNGERRAKLGSAAGNSARKKFSLERMVAGFLKIVDADSAVGCA